MSIHFLSTIKTFLLTRPYFSHGNVSIDIAERIIDYLRIGHN